jgi:hypothetical protein
MSNQAIIGLLLFLSALLISTGIAYVLDRIKYKNVEDRLDLVWDYLIKRAETEFIVKGLGTINSPYLITDEVRSWYAPIAKDLKNFYSRVGVNFTDRELFVMIDKD